MNNRNEIIRTENLKRSFPQGDKKIEVLNGIDLTIFEKEFVAIMGKSGSGKTTLLKLIGLLDRSTKGKVFYKGKDSFNVRGDTLATVRRKELGFIYQDYYLMDSLSVLENIMLPEVLDHKDAKRCYEDGQKIACLMGVDPLLDKRTFELSGGEKQRVAICRALINDPNLILADEPTGNLDSASTEVVMSHLSMINKDMGKTIIMVTHDPNVASYCDRVIFIKDGLIGSEISSDGNRESFRDKIIDNQKIILYG